MSPWPYKVTMNQPPQSDSPTPSRGAHQQSRMDKLFALLENATTAPGVRRLSAKQIASVVESRPEDCNLVLGRLISSVLSANSDIRVCSAFSIELVAKSAKIETLDFSIADRSLEDFDLEKILDEQQPLLASVGAEFEADPKMTAKMQKQNLKEVFSLAKGVEIGDMTDDLVKEEDLTAKPPDSPTDKPMSAREKAMAKRKAKMSNGASAKKISVGNGISALTISDSEEAPISKAVSYLCDNLYSPAWFVRHGALLGLEAIFAGQGHTGPSDRRQSLAHSLISLLALDRFGDYNGDHMVAPVREAAAAVLGIIAGDDLTDLIAASLSQLVSCQELWQIRHAGLMGLFKLDFKDKKTINRLVEAAPALLSDTDDDVKTLTAKLLCRVLPLVKELKHDSIFESVLQLLEQADDLSSAVSPVLELLCLLAEYGYSSDRLGSLLLPYFRSPLSMIRKQCLQTVKAMKTLDERIKRQCLQVVCLEEQRDIADLAHLILRGVDIGMFSDFLPIIFTEVGSPLPTTPFQFYSIGSDKPSSTPPSYELSFKAADAMIIEPNTAARQRLDLAGLFGGVFEDLSHQPRGSLFNPLVCLLKPKVSMELVDDGSARSRMFKAIYENKNAVQAAIEYFGSGDLEVLVDLAAELLADLISDTDILRLPLGTYQKNSPAIRLCKHKHMDINRTKDLLASCKDKLELVFVLLNAGSKVSVEECMSVIIDCIESGTGLKHVNNVYHSFFERFPHQAIMAMLTKLLPILTNDNNEERRLSIMKCIESIVMTDDDSIIPFAPFLLFPCLSRMSDQSAAVRQVASPVFATLVRLIPLDVALPAGMESFEKDLEECRKFISALSDPSKMLTCMQVPVSVKATLRPYQQTGYSWMLFLQRYGLHGALCDDMGLGKTLQTLSCLAYYYEKHGGSDLGTMKRTLILCPATLLGHWKHECSQYTPHLKVLVYTGKPQERRRQLNQSTDCHLIVAAYDIFRNDQEHFLAEDYGYLVMDEAHLVKNVKSRLWMSVRQVKAQHRLCLTGTPIQNHVGELWALFDILMPGYLGDARHFSEHYAKPIQAASQANAGARDFAMAQERLQLLHKQVLPFILRRMKEDVLTDLPPKVIQDYECDLGEEQALLYQTLVEPVATECEHAGEPTETANRESDDSGSMQKMVAFRKICIHPAITLEDPQTPAALRQQVLQMIKSTKRPVDDISLSPKLELLRDLMVSCGIAASVNGDASDFAADDGDNIASKHRMLIFAQQKRALDIVEAVVLQKSFPNVSFLRLDGDVPAAERQDLVHRFNRDPSIPVMLLTTKVGGLGLNLTGADTVVFLEHDWNPMADLQAMDRCHRLGQRRVVSVYRLITKGTVEERIMGLQQWKLRVANAVVNQQNASMSTMETAGLLDLLSSKN